MEDLLTGTGTFANALGIKFVYCPVLMLNLFMTFIMHRHY